TAKCSSLAETCVFLNNTFISASICNRTIDVVVGLDKTILKLQVAFCTQGTITLKWITQYIIFFRIWTTPVSSLELFCYNCPQDALPRVSVALNLNYLLRISLRHLDVQHWDIFLN